MLRLLIPILLLLPTITSVFASEVATVDLGEKLFNSDALGSNGKRCSTCHPDGKGLQEVGDYDDEMLKEMINFCIRDALKGEMLKPDSAELNALFSFVKGIRP